MGEKPTQFRQKLKPLPNSSWQRRESSIQETIYPEDVIIIPPIPVWDASIARFREPPVCTKMTIQEEVAKSIPVHSERSETKQKNAEVVVAARPILNKPSNKVTPPPLKRTADNSFHKNTVVVPTVPRTLKDNPPKQKMVPAQKQPSVPREFIQPLLVTDKDQFAKYWPSIFEQFIAIDCEFTGSTKQNPGYLFEVACVRYRGLCKEAVWHKFCRPEESITPYVQNLTGYSTDFLDRQPPFSHFVLEFEAFIGQNIPLVIHDALPDLRVLEQALNKSGRDPKYFMHGERPIIDTLRLSLGLDLGKVKKRKLDVLGKYYDVDNVCLRPHQARDDAELLGEVFCRMIQAHQKELDIRLL